MTEQSVQKTQKIKVAVTNIEWDVDHSPEMESLPKDLELEMTVDRHIYPEDLEQLVSDEISNQTGFCHKGFAFESL